MMHFTSRNPAVSAVIATNGMRPAHLRGASSPFLRENSHPIQVLPHPSGALLTKQREISSVHIGSLIVHVCGSLDLGT